MPIANAARLCRPPSLRIIGVAGRWLFWAGRRQLRERAYAEAPLGGRSDSSEPRWPSKGRVASMVFDKGRLMISGCVATTCRWFSKFTTVGILLASASNLLCTERLLAGNRLADVLVGSWQSAIVMTEDGPIRTEFMFGKNGVLVVTLIDESKPKGQPGSVSYGAQYKIVGEQLVCEAIDSESEMPRIHIDGQILEIRGKNGTNRFTRKSKDESVAAYISSLITDLKASDRERRWRAAQGIRYVGPEAREAIPVLRETLKDRNSSYRQCALEALINIGPEEKGVLPVVIEKLNDRTDPILSGIAAQGLGKLGARAKEAVPALIDLLRTGEESNQCSNQFHAAEALGNIGPDARVALPALSEWAKDKSEAKRSAAAEAIKKIDSSATRKPRPK